MQPLPLMLNHILVKMRKITLKNLNPNSKTITSLKKIISDQHDLQRSPVTTKVFKLGNENLEPSSLEKLQDAKPKQTGGSQQLLSLLQLHLQVDRNVPSITATRLQDIHLLRVVLTIVWMAVAEKDANLRDLSQQTITPQEAKCASPNKTPSMTAYPKDHCYPSSSPNTRCFNHHTLVYLKYKCTATNCHRNHIPNK